MKKATTALRSYRNHQESAEDRLETMMEEISKEKLQAVLEPENKALKLPKIELREVNGKMVPSTTSRAIAEFTGKEHKHVLDRIEELKSEFVGIDLFIQENDNLVAEISATKLSNGELVDFVKDSYENRGKKYPEFIMTEEFATNVLASFGTAAAVRWKRAFIAEFIKMRDERIELKHENKTLKDIISRERGDVLAELYKLQGKVVDALTPSTVMNGMVSCAYTKAVNIATIGEHKKGQRQHLSEEQALELLKYQIAALHHMLDNRSELKNYDWDSHEEIVPSIKK